MSYLTASQDGSRIAYRTILGTILGNGHLDAINVITGTTTRYWTTPALDAPGSTGLLGITSFSADGSELGWITGHATDAVSSVIDTGTAWLLPVDSALGSAASRSHAITTGPPGTIPSSTFLSADGRRMYLLSFSVPATDRSGAEEDILSSDPAPRMAHWSAPSIPGRASREMPRSGRP